MDPVWELYHENSKNGRRLGAEDPRPSLPDPRSGPPSRRPLVALGPPLQQEAGGAAPLVSARGFTRTALSRLLAIPPPADADLVLLAIHAPAVIDLTVGLYFFDPGAHALALEKSRDLSARLASAVLPAGLPAGSPLQVLIASELGLAAARHGERGYRRALMAAGAWSQAVADAAAGMGLRTDRLDFYDREVDDLLGLDGLTRGTVAVLAIVPGERG